MIYAQKNSFIIRNTVVFTLFFTTLISGVIFSSFTASATESLATADTNASVNVALACTMNGTITNPHTATIPNGTSNSSIGETTLKAFCNDANGFAIYAVGYTNNEYGKTVLTNPTIGATHDIVTGTAVGSIGNVDISNWAMKLTAATDSVPTYPIVIENSFSSFHEVPSVFTMVAQRSSGTDINPVGQQTAEGSTLTTTYQAYISKTQPAGTYTGQVKYTLIHPSTAPEPVADNQIGIIYDGNGLFFDQAQTKRTNKVIYEKQCEDEYGYIANTPAIMKTRNLGTDGAQDGPYSYVGGTFYDGNGTDPDYLEFEGASKVKMVIRYGLTQHIDLIDPFINGSSIEGEECGDFCNNSIDRAGTATIIREGSSVGIYSQLGGMATHSGYDYGIYAQIYPIYDEPAENTTYGVVENVCTYHPRIGTYAETIPWNGHWYKEEADYTIELYSEDNPYDGVLSYLNYNDKTLAGTTITLSAYNPYKIIYNGNGATAGAMRRTLQQFEEIPESIDLISPNYSRSGYGFAGWSTKHNASVNSSDRIFGPNETIDSDDLSFDATKETNLYAVWVGPENNINMQTFDTTAEPYASYAVGTVIALKDARDNNTYAIAKLADGNWWTIENLRLNPASAVDQNRNSTINTSTTNAPTDTFTNDDVVNILNGTDTSYWKTCTSIAASCVNHISFGLGNITDINDALDHYPSSQGQRLSWYSYGVMYNWYTATAGRGNLNSLSYRTEGDICPYGWYLPTSHELVDNNVVILQSYDNLIFNRLGATGDNTESSNLIRAYPNNFIYSGVYRGTSTIARGSNGEYWMSYGSPYNNAASFLNFSKNSLQTTRRNNSAASKVNGLAVRCVASN